MHELAITDAVVDAVLERVGALRIARVAVEVGALTGVVPAALRSCFDVCTAGTPLDGAVLDVVAIAARGRCRHCGDEVAVTDPIPVCACGSADVAVSGGDELRIVAVEAA